MNENFKKLWNVFDKSQNALLVRHFHTFSFKRFRNINMYIGLHGSFPTLQQIKEYTTTLPAPFFNIHAPFVVFQSDYNENLHYRTSNDYVY
jgi:hypothetical protein